MNTKKILSEMIDKKIKEAAKLPSPKLPSPYSIFSMGSQRIGERLSQLGLDIRKSGTSLSKNDVITEIMAIKTELDKLVNSAKSLPDVDKK